MSPASAAISLMISTCMRGISVSSTWMDKADSSFLLATRILVRYENPENEPLSGSWIYGRAAENRYSGTSTYDLRENVDLRRIRRAQLGRRLNTAPYAELLEDVVHVILHRR